jgi:phosphatidate cytidylyltransferase
MTSEHQGADAEVPAPKVSRAGRDLPAAIAVGVGLVLLVVASLTLYKPAFVPIVVVAIGLGIAELRTAFAAVGIHITAWPVQLGSLAMLLAAYLVGADAMVVAVALTVLMTALWRLRGGAPGYVRDVTAGVFTSIYVPFLACFVLLMLREDNGQWQVATFIVVTICSDIGGYASGVVFGRHPMAPLISPKKSWEGFAGSAVFCAAGGAVALPALLGGEPWEGALIGLAGSAVACCVAGWLTVVYLLGGAWWAGVLLGAITVVTATLGDLTESVIKRDLGIKDMSRLLPGHGGLMDRLDSLLATVPFAWMVMHFVV